VGEGTLTYNTINKGAADFSRQDYQCGIYASFARQ
jgi:hypothetical protein